MWTEILGYNELNAGPCFPAFADANESLAGGCGCRKRRFPAARAGVFFNLKPLDIINNPIAKYREKLKAKKIRP